ncbi:MAG: hypothetical protein U5N86_01685 [Planctomycetota bacterium]|nr:hypothetical protein [Planctomycetota bacterium]
MTSERERRPGISPKRPENGEGNDKMSDKNPLTYNSQNVANLFGSVCDTVRARMKDGVGPVDVELTLNSVSISSKGFLVFKKSSESSSVSITLKTRVLNTPQKQD